MTKRRQSKSPTFDCNEENQCSYDQGKRRKHRSVPPILVVQLSLEQRNNTKAYCSR
jgi:hypothetical protein